MQFKLWKDRHLKKRQHYGFVKDNSGAVYEPHFGFEIIGVTSEKLTDK